MRVAVEKLPGVADAEVSLNEGRVEIRFDGAHPVSLAEVRELIRKQGFSPQEATITVSGEVSTRDGHLVIVVPGADSTYRLEAEPTVLDALSERSGTVVLEGRVERDEDEVTPILIQVGRVIS